MCHSPPESATYGLGCTDYGCRWHWISMRDHLAGHPDEKHAVWRKVHPGPLAPNPKPDPDPDHDPEPKTNPNPDPNQAHPGPLERPMEAEEITLWHVLRDWHRAHGEPGEGEGKKGEGEGKKGGGEGKKGEGEGEGGGEGDTTVRFCNRLDRGTSGIVCVATTARLAERVQAC